MSDPTSPGGAGPPDAGAPEPDLDPEIAELVRAASASDNPEAKWLLPLPPAAVDDLVRRALDAAPDAKPEATEKVVPLPQRARWSRWIPLAAAAALALGAAALFLARGPGPPSYTAYILEIHGDSAQRGDPPAPDGEPVKLRPETRLRARLTPVSPVRDKMLRVLVVRGGRATLLGPPPFAITREGAIAIDAPAREVLGEQENGAAELVLVVGRQVPDDDALVRLAEDPGRRPAGDFDVARRAVQFEGWGKTGMSGPPKVEFAGCEAVLEGPVCEVGAGSRLRFWVSGGPVDLRAAVDTQVVCSSPEARGGAPFTVAPPAGAKEIRLLAPSGEEVFRLPLRPALDLPALTSARRLAKEGKLPESEEALREAEKDGRPEVSLQVLRQRARNARRGGDAARARGLFQEAIARDHQAGRLSDEIDDRHVLVVGALTELDFAGAEAGLAASYALEERCPDRRPAGDYYRSFLATELGLVRRALEASQRMARDADRLGLPEERAGAKAQLAELLGIVGRRAEARRLALASVAEAGASPDPCEQAKILTGAAWVLWRDAGARSDPEQTVRVAKQAVDIARGRCPSSLPIALLNQAFGELQAGRSAAARSLLGEASRAAPRGSRRFDAWSEVLGMELDLLESPEVALRRAEDLRARSEESLSPEPAFLAELSRARALDALGRTDDAGAAFAAAGDALDRWSALVPLGEGREGFFAQQEKLRRLAVDFQVRQAEAAAPGAERERAVRAAAETARRSLGRFFRTLAFAERADSEERADAKELRGYLAAREAADKVVERAGRLSGRDRDTLSAAQQRAFDRRRAAEPAGAPESEAGLSLVYHPIATGWVGFAIGAQSAVMAKIGAMDLDDEERPGDPDREMSTKLLGPFREQIRRATAIRVQAHGALRLLPFEALPWGDGVLSDAAAVSYGLDAPALQRGAAEGNTACVEAPRALLVTNPWGDLAGAEEAGDVVERTLGARGYRVTRLRGEEATPSAVERALAHPCTAVFHYDGHAHFAGVDGLRAALRLAREEVRKGDVTTVREALAVEDVRRLARVPPAVVLLGCSTAKDEGLGLAQAFLEAGASEVVASIEDVEDALATRIAGRLYEAAPAAKDGPPRLAQALQAATRPLRSESAKAGGPAGAPRWWAFRVLAR